jgi:hypothetical protein
MIELSGGRPPLSVVYPDRRDGGKHASPGVRGDDGAIVSPASFVPLANFVIPAKAGIQRRGGAQQWPVAT